MARQSETITDDAGGDGDVALLKTLADATRLRLVRVLFREELNVQELSRILKIAQPSISRHLGVLRGAGLVDDRREGNRVYYQLLVPRTAPKSLREFIQDVGHSPHTDLDRLDEALADRAREATRFADRSAACWDDVGRLLHQSSALLTAFASLAPRGLRLADLGTGTGLLLPFFSRMAEHVYAVDQSSEMLRRACRRCERLSLDNVSIVHKSLEELSSTDFRVDGGIVHFVLHQVASPPKVLQQLHAVLREGGRLVIIDRLPHEDREAEKTFGSFWLGFSKEQMLAWSEQAGLEFLDWVSLPASEEADEQEEVFVSVLARPAPAASN